MYYRQQIVTENWNPALRHKFRRNYSLDALAFLLPALQFLQIQLIGTLYATDLLALVIICITPISKAPLGQRHARLFLFLGLLWLAGQVTADSLRSTPFEDYARGWSMIGFTLINFSALYLILEQNHRRIILCALGLGVGGILSYLVEPSPFAGSEPWKFGYGFPITLFIMLAVVFLSWHRRWALGIMVVLAAAALNLYEGSRGLSGLCFLVAGYVRSSEQASHRQEEERTLGVIRAPIGFVLLAFSAVGMLQIYQCCARSGLLGELASQKFEAQSSGRYGVFMGGRTEFFVGVSAALDSPIIGHGSWAKDWRYAGEIGSLRADTGYENLGSADSWLIPSHSCIVGAWVNAGFLGLLFWLWVLSLPMRALIALRRGLEPMAPLIAFFALGLIWDVLFSPYAAERRFITPYFIAVMMSILGR